ncbi:MAG TPA: VOC family protein [Chitinophagaceae bacterium]|jgi:catechol 2,3-dioxygenase-like lactoylglutathione lyase family enzyme|nr:VOC family protein [Chitinophagaceae bacterium]
MTRLDPIIAVKDVEASSKWYQKIFGFKNNHGGDHFSVLVSDDNEIILCLHKWNEHNHPTMTSPDITVGNGLLFYFRTENMDMIYQNAIKADCVIEEEVHLNPNSLRQEFSFRDPDGYFLTVTEFHKYEG